MKKTKFYEKIINWYKKYGRKDLPWKKKTHIIFGYQKSCYNKLEFQQ